MTDFRLKNKDNKGKFLYNKKSLPTSNTKYRPSLMSTMGNMKKLFLRCPWCQSTSGSLSMFISGV